MSTQTKQSQSALTPREALQLLKDGNARFLANRHADRNLLEQVKETATGQFPFAVILSCIDSRVSAELTFDQGVGDIFSVRIAGNVLNEDILGSMEFACQLANSKLIAVVGHSSCGAIKGACANAELGHLTGLLAKVSPVIKSVQAAGDVPEDKLVQRVAEANVEHVVSAIQQQSPVLAGLIESGSIGLVGGMYSVESGAVEFGELISGAN